MHALYSYHIGYNETPTLPVLNGPPSWVVRSASKKRPIRSSIQTVFIAVDGGVYARGWMDLGSLLLGITCTYSFKVNAVSHVSDSLLILLIRQYIPSTSRLPLDW